MDEPANGPTRYRLGPRSRRGLIAGWRSGQIACVGTGLFLAVATMRSAPGLGGLLLALLLAAVSFAAATWSVKGLSVEEWAPTVTRYVLRSVAEGHFRPWTSKQRGLGGALGHLSVFQLPGDEPIGVVTDGQCATWTAVVPVGGNGFALVSEDERAARIAAWSAVLAAMASEAVGPHRLQWVARTYPAVLDGPPGTLPTTSAMAATSNAPAAAYERLLEDVTSHLWSREVLVALSIRAPGGRKAAAGRQHAAALRHQLARMSDRLRSAGLYPEDPLSPRLLARCLRRSFDLSMVDDTTFWPWPVGIEEGWGWLHTDSSWQATYWIAEWPRAEVGTQWLLPMLLGTGPRRTLSITMAPVSPQRATRRAEHERTSGAADAELRRRHGFAVTARARREQEARLQRELELADGHTGFRYSGYVTVTSETYEGLNEACRRAEQAAALARLELRRLFGSQQDGFCCSLPIGRGCR
ncbi:MAG: SCO6880 family protein [Acidimicrobiales bacterium]